MLLLLLLLADDDVFRLKDMCFNMCKYHVAKRKKSTHNNRVNIEMHGTH